MTHKTTENLLKERGKTYGDAVETHERIAAVWTGILNREVTAHEVAMCMVGLKMVRSTCSPEHRDNLEDVLGYTVIAQRILGQDKPADYGQLGVALGAGGDDTPLMNDTLGGKAPAKAAKP